MSVTFNVVCGDIDGPSLNVHNGNAREIFDRLGVEWNGDIGEMNAREFRRRLESAISLLHEEGDPAVAPTSDGRVHFGGRPPGRMLEHLRTLWEICDAAGDLGVVRWY